LVSGKYSQCTAVIFAVFVLVAADALHHIAITQAGHIAGEEAAVTLARHFHEVFGFNPQFAAEGHGALAEFRVQRVVRRETFFDLIGRIVVDDQLEWIENGDAALVGLVHYLTHGVFKQHVINQ
jgi:hypothetical protein